MRMLASGCAFFIGPECKWNIFELMLVLHSFADFLEEMSGNTSFLRIVKLARILKLLRVLRVVRCFRELRFILNSLMSSFGSTFWSLLLVALTIYIFGLIFLQATVRFLQENQLAPAEEERLLRSWGSLTTAMTTLLQASTGGEDWGSIAEPLNWMGDMYYGFFLFYLLSFMLVVMNTVTGLFVEATMNQSTHDRAMLIQNELDRKEEYIEQLRSLFEEIDANGDGRMHMLEFLNTLRDPRMQAFVGTLNIDVSDAVSFFQMLVNNSDNPEQGIDSETFVVGCIKLQGEAKAQDIYEVISNQKRMLKRMSVMGTLLECMWADRLAGAAGELSSRVSAASLISPGPLMEDTSLRL